MKIKQTVKPLVVGLLLAVGLIAVTSPVVSAQASCGGVDTAIVSCKEEGGDNLRDSGLWGVLLLAINILTAGVGIAAVAGVVYGSILYTSAAGNAEQVKKAMGIITNVVIGVIAYALMFAFLNFLIPGGLFAQ